jgi:hypothetical protein
LKRLYFAAVLALLFSMLGTSAHAQSNFSVYFGMGSATDSASKADLNNCPPNGTGPGTCNFITGNPQSQPSLGGVFGMIGADYMFKRWLGFGGEDSFHFSQADYLGLGIRPSFFDFNAVIQPLPKSAKIVPEIQGGLGGAHLSFYAPVSCLVTCTNGLVQTSNHFQLHFSGGVRFYITHGIFIRPQFDGRWVHNFVEYGGSFVPEYTVAVGYTFGGR